MMLRLRDGEDDMSLLTHRSDNDTGSIANREVIDMCDCEYEAL